MILLAQEREPKPSKRLVVCPIIVRRDEEGRTKLVYDCGPVDKMKQLYEKIENPLGGCLVIVERNEQGKPRVRSVCGSAERLEQLLRQL